MTSRLMAVLDAITVRCSARAAQGAEPVARVQVPAPVCQTSLSSDSCCVALLMVMPPMLNTCPFTSTSQDEKKRLGWKVGNHCSHCLASVDR